MSNRVVHFEIPTTDTERTKAFYGAVFGWEFPLWMEEPPYWGVMTAPQDSTEMGINGGLWVREASSGAPDAPNNAFVCTVQVDSYEDTHNRILEAGGTVAVPKQAIPGMAWQGYYRDPDGNTFGIHQPDESAR